jgi:hypothetical protein
MNTRSGFPETRQQQQRSEGAQYRHRVRRHDEEADYLGKAEKQDCSE